MIEEHHIVYLIDDDASMLRALERLMRASGFNARAFSSVEEFLESPMVTHDACVVADVRMPLMSGLELPRRLRELDREFPLILISADDSETTRTRAREVGARAFFRKPVDDQALLDAIEFARSP